MANLPYMEKHRGFPGRLPGTDFQFVIRRANKDGATALSERIRYPDRRPADKRADEGFMRALLENFGRDRARSRPSAIGKWTRRAFTRSVCPWPRLLPANATLDRWYHCVRIGLGRLDDRGHGGDVIRDGGDRGGCEAQEGGEREGQ